MCSSSTCDEARERERGREGGAWPVGLGPLHLPLLPPSLLLHDSFLINVFVLQML